jgi:hypothetical protein
LLRMLRASYAISTNPADVIIGGMNERSRSGDVALNLSMSWRPWGTRLIRGDYVKTMGADSRGRRR